MKLEHVLQIKHVHFGIQTDFKSESFGTQASQKVGYKHSQPASHEKVSEGQRTHPITVVGTYIQD